MDPRTLAEDDALLPDWLRDALLARIEGELGLPVLPDTACRIMAACKDEHSELHELAELVTHDQSLAAHVLRVANSVAFAPKAPILSLRQAMSRLGLSTVSDIAIAVAIKQRVFSVPGYEARIRELWHHSVATACYARDVAQLLRRDADGAFVCGLLHDVGMPIAMQAVCDLARERGESVRPEVMEAAMRRFHGEIGARIAQRWRIAPTITATIRYHHDPTGAKQLREDVLVVALADELAYRAPDEPRADEDSELERLALRDLNLSADHLQGLRGARERILELARAFQ